MSIFSKKDFIERMAVILIITGVIMGFLFFIETNAYFRSILLLVAIITLIVVGFILMSYHFAKEENSPGYYVHRGLQGTRSKAIENYKKALALDPNIQLAYQCLGDAYEEKGQYDMAIENYNNAIAINPDDDWVYYSRGKVYMSISEKNFFLF